MSKTRAEIHLTCCKCPHVNIVIVDRDGSMAHYACDADQADLIADQIRQLANEARAINAQRLRVGHA